MNENDLTSKKNEVAKYKMSYIEKILSLNRKKFNKYINDHKNHFIVTVEKLRSEIIILIIYVHRAKKRLRDLIKLKIITNMKLYRDIQQFNAFEMKI